MKDKKIYTGVVEKTTFVASHTLAPEETYTDYVYGGADTNLIRWFHERNFYNLFHEKIVVDSGSGLGAKTTLISFFEPKKIISVEQDLILLEKQKVFLNSNIFPFLPNKKITDNIEYIHQNIEDFIENNNTYDVLCLFYVHPYINVEKIFKNLKKDVLIMAHIKDLNNGNLFDIVKNSGFYFTYEEIMQNNGIHFVINMKNNA